MDRPELFESDVIEEIHDEATWQQKVDEADRPTLVEFFVTWCPHCQREAPVLDGVAQLLKDEGLGVYHANAEVMWQKGAIYGLEETPSFILVDHGQLIARHEGFLTAEEIIDFAHQGDPWSAEGTRNEQRSHVAALCA